MSETMSNVERGLWRIAELGARCSQQSAAGSRGALWTELEQTIARLNTELEAARQAVDIAPAQVRSLEGRLAVAKKERDRERLRADENQADADSARRERDRERAKSAKAAEAAAAAKATAAQCVARAAAAQAALDQATTARDEALAARDEAVNARDRALAAADEAKARITALEAELDGVRAELDTVRGERDGLVAAQEAANAGRADALDTLAARADGAVVVLPGVALPEAEAGPITPAARVPWRPAWSEWADDAGADQRVPEDGAADGQEPATEDTNEIVLAAAEDSARRYLNVAATIGQLLPDDLSPLLLSGATVLRREGRLFATLAVTADPWAPPGANDGAAQAKKLADAGFRVEWTTDAPLAC